MEKTIQNHLNRVRDRLIRGRDLLGTLYVKDMKSYNVPDVTVDLEVLHRHVPSEQDKFVQFAIVIYPPILIHSFIGSISLLTSGSQAT